MYPAISHLIKDLTGGVYIPFPFATFGFFVALSFIISVFFLKQELKRKEKEKLIKYIIAHNPAMSRAQLEDLSYEKLIIIKTQLEWEWYQRRTKQNDNKNKN